VPSCSYLATIDGGWAAAVCDDRHADLHPRITVTVTFYAARARFLPGGESVAVIRQWTAATTTTPISGTFRTPGSR
jgi:hypothetical protein